MARILIGVSGGIAAYKAVELARLATLAGHGVRVTMTDAASRFVGAATFEGITGAPVLVDEFERDPLRGTYPGEAMPAHDPISHLAVVEAPAAGICDSFLTTSFLACTAPRIVAPAMNGRMWEAAATAANVATLRERGVTVLEPAEGALASRGERGPGRMPEPDQVLAAIESAIGSGSDLAGARVVVTAGGTREPIDPVRFIGNRSSGRMGLALADAAARRGADVTLIAANVALPAPPSVARIDVATAAELEAATTTAFADADVLLMAAAVSDFRPADPSAAKLVREGGPPPALELEATADVLGALAARRRAGQLLVGFAAEHGGDFVVRARSKLDRKGVDAIVVNDVSDPAIGFESADNEVTVVTAEGEERLPRGTKTEVAGAILDRIVAMRG